MPARAGRGDAELVTDVGGGASSGTSPGWGSWKNGSAVPFAAITLGFRVNVLHFLSPRRSRKIFLLTEPQS